MVEMVPSRSMQMLLDLADKYKYPRGLVQEKVNELVLLHGNIEKLLINDGNSREVKENIRKIRNLVYTIEDALETLAVKVEAVEFKASKNEKKRGITRLLRKLFRWGDKGSRIILVTSMSVMESILEGQPLIKWLHDTFPEVFESEGSAVLDRSLAHRKSLQWHRLMYTHDMEDHFVEMKDDLEKLVELVADQDKQHRVVSIYGVKGLGKTNLARRVYIDPKVRSHFSAFAWVSLNQDYQIDDLLQNILNQLDAGALKKSAEEKMKVSEEKKPEAVKKSAEEQEKGVEEKKGGVEEKKTGVDETKEGAQEQEKGVEEKKRGAEEKGSLFTNIMRIGAGKKSAAEHKKGAEEKKEGVDEKKEDAEEQDKGTEEKKEGVVKQEKGVEEKKEGAEEKGSLFTNIMRIGAGKKSAAERKKGAEEIEECVDEKTEGVEEQSKSSDETVMDKLKKILSNQRCFIVIDDVSESSQWDYISSEFLMEGAVTRFLLTTENEEIAGVGLSHKLCLNDDKGWELLQKYAFRGKKAPDLGLLPKLGKEMVQQCRGLPSEISRLGRILSKMSFLSEWHNVNDDVAGYLQSEAEESKWNESIDEQSDPNSYDGLPYGEKQCFLYLAMFKEDEGVDPEDLSFLWMAEGMVSTDHQLEKTTTEYYLQELASMLHVQVDELSTNMRLSLRKYLPEWSLHLGEKEDLRERSLHLGEKEDFRLKVVDFSGGKRPRFDRYTLSDGTRRLVIHFNKPSSPVERDLNATEDLRSLLFLNSDQEYVNLPVKISDFSKFKLLRILHFVRCKFEGRKLPEGIWKLLNLRYFGVLYCDLDKLPPSIANFRNLQVLNVRSYDESKMVIPNVISQMKSLKHVRLPSYLDHEQPDKLKLAGLLDLETSDKLKLAGLLDLETSVKLKLDGLVDLETLDGFNADIHDLDSLSKLEKLQHLSTRAYSNASLESIIEFVKSHGARIRTNLVIEHSCDLTSLEAMPVLEEVLMCPNLNALTFSMVVLPMFPNCRKFASKQLTQIKLIGCKLREDPMEALGKFPDLRKLCLGYGAFVGTKIDIRDGGFPSLEYLEFRCLPNLEEWNVDEGAMKKLSTLIMRKCPKLKGIPYELASHKTLNKVEIELPPTALCDGCHKIYNRKLKFVKSLNIRKLDPLQEIEKYKLSGRSPIQVPVGPTTRARAKKFKEVLNGLVEEVWAQEWSKKPIREDVKGNPCVNLISHVWADP